MEIGSGSGALTSKKPFRFPRLRNLVLNIEVRRPTEEKKLVYVSEGIPFQPGLNWVVLDPNGDKVVKDYVPEMQYPKAMDDLYGYRCCVVSKKVYFIGGIHEQTGEETSDVFIFDLETKQWEDDVKPMQKVRNFPVVVSIGNMIYVFGRCAEEDPCKENELTQENWIECYDTTSTGDEKVWKFVPHPPPLSLVKANFLKFHAVVGGRRLILLWADDDTAYSYQYVSGEWLKEGVMPAGPDWNYNIVTYGDHLLWHYYGKIYASNFIWKIRSLLFVLPDSRFGNGPICEDEGDNPYDIPEPTFLVSTGTDKLCLVWHEFYGEEKLRCYTFSINSIPHNSIPHFKHGMPDFSITLNERASFMTQGSGVEHALIAPA